MNSERRWEDDERGHYDEEGNKINIAKTARMYGLSPRILAQRLDYGWPLKKAIHTPPRKLEMTGKYSRYNEYEFNGEKKTLEEIAEILELDLSMLIQRIRKGVTPETGLFLSSDEYRFRNRNRKMKKPPITAYKPKEGHVIKFVAPQETEMERIGRVEKVYRTIEYPTLPCAHYDVVTEEGQLYTIVAKEIKGYADR
ncbi:hypothetical protein ACP26L_36235 (plasmid) [Paenibacillus sp. S-38]|uniref:hypothetical protein n=1 Tax=Paenibacillus sp. S-38 TaxID=3416710 RepID=UPI003CF78884